MGICYDTEPIRVFLLITLYMKCARICEIQKDSFLKEENREIIGISC